MIDQALNRIGDAFGAAHQALFEAVVQPVLFGLGQANLLEDGFGATGWLLVGLVQLTIIVIVFGTLQRLRPVEPITDQRAVRVDILYTLIHRLGLFRLALFFTIDPLWDLLFGQLSLAGWSGVHLDAALAPLLPGFSDTAWFAFVVYLLVFDFADYWLHRGQHRLRWWWALHSLHHSQRQMTMWSDNRNHLLDDLLRDVALVLLARTIGVAPSQFVAIVALTQLIESLSHANVRMGFGRSASACWSARVFIGCITASASAMNRRGRGSLGGHNFAVLFPIWDVAFRHRRISRTATSPPASATSCLKPAAATTARVLVAAVARVAAAGRRRADRNVHRPRNGSTSLAAGWLMLRGWQRGTFDRASTP